MNLRNFLFSKLLTNLLLAIFIQAMFGSIVRRLQISEGITEITLSITHVSDFGK